MNKIQVEQRKANKLNGELSYYLKFKYDSFAIDKIRKLPNRFWHTDSKEWEIPINKLDYLREQLGNYIFNVKIIDKDVEITENKEIDNFINNFYFKTNPYSHQIDGLKYGLTHDKWLLADEMGLGKTRMAIDIAIAQRQIKGFSHCLIVCGVNGLKWNWQKEIEIHSNETGYILGQQVKNGKIVIGSTVDKLNDIKNIDNINHYFIITNIETLRNEDIVAELKKCCESGIIGMCVLDEAHVVRNPSSEQGKGLLKILPKYRLAMTGTPIMNNPLDMYSILKWLGYEKYSYYIFKNHYCVMGGFGGHEIIGYSHLDELQDRVSKIMLRRLKEDVLDLPEKIYTDEFVEMTLKQKQIYDEVRAEIKLNIDQIKMSNNPLAELIRMRQATGYTGILSSKVIESAKFDRVKELAEESINNNKKVVIFSNWTQIVNPLYSQLSKKYKGIIITGETKDEERQVYVNLFQNNPDCKFAIGTIGAMGTGITMTEGSTVIFLDEPWNNALKEQAIDRCHRIGQKNKLTIYTIMCHNTIDEKIHNLIEKKGLMADMIVDGKIIGNREALLNYLID